MDSQVQAHTTQARARPTLASPAGLLLLDQCFELTIIRRLAPAHTQPSTWRTLLPPTAFRSRLACPPAAAAAPAQAVGQARLKVSLRCTMSGQACRYVISLQDSPVHSVQPIGDGTGCLACMLSKFLSMFCLQNTQQIRVEYTAVPLPSRAVTDLCTQNDRVQGLALTIPNRQAGTQLQRTLCTLHTWHSRRRRRSPPGVHDQPWRCSCCSCDGQAGWLTSSPDEVHIEACMLLTSGVAPGCKSQTHHFTMQCRTMLPLQQQFPGRQETPLTAVAWSRAHPGSPLHTSAPWQHCLACLTRCFCS